MNVITTSIPDVLIIEPRVFEDARGYFFESFSQREFDEKVAPILGHTIKFVQDNESKSSYGVMRGLHFQRPPFTQSKLVRCVKGAVLDVAVDIRKGSPTYGQHVSVILAGADMIGSPSPFGEGWDEAVHRQFFIPKALLTASPYSLKQLCSSTSVMSSIIQRQTEASAYWTNLLALIGEFQQIEPSFQRKIPSIRC